MRISVPDVRENRTGARADGIVEAGKEYLIRMTAARFCALFAQAFSRVMSLMAQSPAAALRGFCAALSKPMELFSMAGRWMSERRLPRPGDPETVRHRAGTGGTRCGRETAASGVSPASGGAGQRRSRPSISLSSSARASSGVSFASTQHSMEKPYSSLIYSSPQ